MNLILRYCTQLVLGKVSLSLFKWFHHTHSQHKKAKTIFNTENKM